VTPSCTEDLACPAAAHGRGCPWHPLRVSVLRLPAEGWDSLVAELERPARDHPELAGMLRRARAEQRPFRREGEA